jgi:uncharacterized protein
MKIFIPCATNETTMAMKRYKSMVNAYKIDAISIEQLHAKPIFIKKIAFDKRASILSFQRLELRYIQHLKLLEEFPNYDVTVVVRFRLEEDCRSFGRIVKLTQKPLA